MATTPKYPGRTANETGHTLDLSLKRALEGDKLYLGDLEGVHAILGLYANQSIEWLVQMSKLEIGVDTMQKNIVAEAWRLADVFLGQDKTVNPMPGWNEPGAIDEFVKAQANIAAGEPRTILFTLFVTVANTALEAAHAADDGAPDETWKGMIDGVLNDTARLLLGIPAHDYEAPGLPAEATAEED